MRVFSFLAVLSAAMVTPHPLLGQWPGEVAGTVHDALTGSPIVGATVGVENEPPTLTDSSGRFRLRSVRPGSTWLVVDAPGYVGLRIPIDVANGQVTRTPIRLQPSPIVLAPVEASGRSTVAIAGSARVLSRADIAATGASTLGDAVRTLPGFNVVQRGSGSAQGVSIRGSDTDAVLVLVDGVPLNDPVSGVADLSLVPAEAIERVTLHVGAASAQFGPRASAGVLDVTTGRTGTGWSAQVGTGSLGSGDGQLEGSWDEDNWSFGTAVSHRSTGGAFSFTLPPEVGGGAGRRDNADHRLTNVQVSADRSGPMYARFRLGADVLDRGLPGPGFSPSPHARQDTRNARFSVDAGQAWGGRTLRTTSYVSVARQRFRDPDPPAGLPYDETSRLSEVASQIAVRQNGGRLLASTELGLSARVQRIRSEGLSADLPDRFTELGVYGAVTVDPQLGGVRFLTRARLDRAGATGTWHGSHAVTLATRLRAVSLELSHRSAFSPPTLADQFFREGVGTRPNPELRAERIPSEFELTSRIKRGTVDAGVSAFTGNVKDRIVWQPDFRFVWSPTNTDVRRTGLDAWVTVDPSGPLALSANYGLARVTYDREGTADSVQLAYRPRHMGGLSAGWSTDAWRVHLAARRTGERFPVPAPVNGLPAFWSWDLTASRSWTRPTWSTEVTARVHRVFDARETLIFGFPDPGRTFALQVRFRRAPSSLKGF